MNGSSANVLGLITARGGSKGVPRKNVLPLAGKPVICWTIDAALKADSLDRVVVSTDDPEIAQISREYGAEVPFTRPAELSEDGSSHVDVVMHAIDFLESSEGYRADCVVLLQPTSPFRDSCHIDSAVNLFYEKSVDSVVGVRPAHPHPYWAKTITRAGMLEQLFPEKEGLLFRPRQELPDAYNANGAVFVFRPEELRASGSIYGKRTYPYVMDEASSLDIDTPWDWHLACLVAKEQMQS